MTTGHLPQPASRGQAHRHLDAVAADLTGHGIATRLSRIGDVPVLTIEEPAAGPDPTTISIHPDVSGPGLPLECTLLWTPAPGMAPEAIAGTIIAVLNAVRPLAAACPAMRRGHVSPMTAAPATASQPRGDDLTVRLFRALYRQFDLRTINGIYVVVPKGTSWFAGHSLGDIARQICDHDHPDRAASPAGPGQTDGRGAGGA